MEVLLNASKRHFTEMTEEEFEEGMRLSVKKAVNNLWDNGLPAIGGDDIGIYEAYRDGRKEYVEYYNK